MRLLLPRFPAVGSLLLFALLAAAALAAPKYFRGNTATLIVATTADSGPGSLRQALVDVPDGGTIQFNPALNGQTITLTSAELVINKNITISGPGSGLLRISRDQQAANFRILHLIPDRTAEISGLTINNGKLESQNGGGILNDHATLTMINCAISGNVANGAPPTQAGGGGIYSNGTLSLVNSTISGNSSVGPWSLGGGGIVNNGTLTITQSIITGNFGDTVGGGINNGGMLTITDSTVSNNHASGFGHGSGYGGGIYTTGTLMIQNTIISGNILNGEAGYGGGVFGPLTAINSTIQGNMGRTGGGIATFGGGSIVTNCTISGNSAFLAGGGISGGGTISNSTISGNMALNGGNGGGIHNGGTITNSTISGNTAAKGGGIYGGGTVTHSTISGNTASQGGIYATSAVHLGNTILKAGSSGANIFNGSGGSVTSHGYNLSSDNGAGFLTGPGDQVNTDPLLGPLQDNGGPTFTHNLLTGSPAIDTGDPSFTPPPATDQRGYLRVFNGRIDIGSLEVQPMPTPTPSPTPTPTPSPGICGILYDQTSNAGTTAIASQNFEAALDTYDSQVADDFVVPAGQTWTVQWVNATGIYFSGPGPAASVNVTFYSNSGNLPGAAVPGGTYTNLSMTDTAGNFSIPLPSNLVLTSGTYWVSVQANMDYSPGGVWGWVDRTVQSNSPAAWQNPGGSFGFGCLTWGARGAACGIDPTTPDQIFQIVGCLGAPTPTATPTATATATATATVTAVPINISGNISYCSNPVPGPVPNVTLTLTGSASGSTLSNGSGNYQFSSLPSGGSYTITPAKTALSPGTAGIDTVDVIAIQRYFLLIGTPLSGCPRIAADANSDSTVTTVDVIAVQRFFLALTTGIANVGKYQFAPGSRSYSVITSDQTGQNYDTLVFGDVVASFVE